MAIGLGLALQWIHIYLSPLHKTLQILWALGSISIVLLGLKFGTTDLLSRLANEPKWIWAIGPLFASLTGVGFKEFFCFRRPEAIGLTLLIPIALLGHLTQLLSGAVVLSLLSCSAILLLILVINGINVGISFVARNVENALVGYDQTGFWNVVTIYAFCLVLALPIRAIQSYLVPRLGLLWREWLSSRMLSRYLSNRAYYLLNPNDEDSEEIDNPDQRISQDTASFTNTSLSVTVEVLAALLTFFSFIIVLWTIKFETSYMVTILLNTWDWFNYFCQQTFGCFE